MPSLIFRESFLRSNFPPPFCSLPSHCELCRNRDWLVSLPQDSHPNSSPPHLGRLRVDPVLGLMERGRMSGQRGLRVSFLL